MSIPSPSQTSSSDVIAEVRAADEAEREEGEYTCVASSRVAPAQKRGTMPRGRVGPPLLAGAQPVLDVTPVVRRGVGRIDADRLDLIDCAQNATDVRPARDAEKDLPPDGQRQGGKGLAGATARRTSMREMIVPKSFDGQRTKAKTLSGAKLTMRTRRLRTGCSAIRPKRTQCSICFSSQVSSTYASASERWGMEGPLAEGMAYNVRLRRCRGIRGRAGRAACRRRSACV